jgi:hypothetical protein
MAYTTINKSTDYFNTKLYTGTGATQAVTGVGFQPDWVWLKSRSDSTYHLLYDAVRGATKQIYSNTTTAEGTDTNTLTSFDSDGFSLGADSGSGANINGYTQVAWNWKANGAGSSNTDGSRTTTVSVNTTAGFSVGTCASLATNNDTLGHGLGAVPKMIMVKNTASTGNWFVYHASLGNTDSLYLNTNGSTLGSTIWNNTTPTSSVFTMKGGDFATGESLVFYAFAEKTGYSKFGSFEGNNNANGTFVYLGFKPSLIITKNVDTGGTNYDWLMFDNKRNTANLNDDFLEANNSDAETTSGRNGVDFLSNGFKCRTSYGDLNSNQTYIYMAFAEAPLVGTNNVPCTAR